jgi:hypothetical protein
MLGLAHLPQAHLCPVHGLPGAGFRDGIYACTSGNNAERAPEVVSQRTNGKDDDTNTNGEYKTSYSSLAV